MCSGTRLAEELGDHFRPHRTWSLSALLNAAIGVLRDLQKVQAEEKLSPVLIAEGDIADGYHRVSLATRSTDPYADVLLKLG
jgi:hypothetical protein